MDIHMEKFKVGRDINFTENQAAAKIDLDRLAQDLGKLRAQMRQEATETSHDKAIVAIGEAEEAAKAGDRRTALSCLQKAGQWALDVATKIGVNVATQAFKTVMGG